jgi:hypothetical protein
MIVMPFIFFVTMHNVFVFVDSICSISITIQNLTRIHMNFFPHDRYSDLSKYGIFVMNRLV